MTRPQSASTDTVAPRRAGVLAQLLAAPFRVFFLLTAVHAALVVLIWTTVVTGLAAPPLAWPGAAWHAHELLFGTLPAAVAGFLLTAMANWTGMPALAGGRLAALAMLWLAGRAVMFLGAALPAPLVAGVDVAFLAVLGAYASRVLWRAGHRRSLLLMVAVAVLAAANLATHLGAGGLLPAAGPYGERLALNAATLLMVIIGGRITPAFTANWMRMAGRPYGGASHPWLERLVLAGTLAVVAASLAGLPPTWVAPLALLAALANGLRLAAWRGWQAAAEPLLWILHLGYAWVVLGLALQGLAPWLGGVPATAWYHAIGVGAMGTLILGVMTRVAVGHTGRALALPRGAVLIYWLVLAAGALRTGIALFPELGYREGLVAAGLAWSGAFVLYVGWYLPILARPRGDGRPG